MGAGSIVGIDLLDSSRVTLREKPAAMFDFKQTLNKFNTLVLQENNNTIHHITVDDNDEFTFYNSDIPQKKGKKVFFYKNKKIAEIFRDDNKLIVKLFSEKQSNLFIDINIKHLEVESKGPVCINGQFYVEERLFIKAIDLCFAGEVVDLGEIEFKVQKTLSLHAAVQTRNIHIESTILVQNSSITATGQYDVVAQIFQHATTARTQVHSLRFVLVQAVIVGAFLVQEKTFFVSNQIEFGASESICTVQFLGENYLHFGSVVCLENTELYVKAIQECNLSKLIIDEECFLEESSNMDVESSIVEVGSLQNKGKIISRNCIFSTGQFKNENTLEAYNSELECDTIYNRGTVTVVSSTLLTNSIVQRKTFNVIDSDLIVIERFLQGGQDVQADFIDSSIDIHALMHIGENNHLTFNNTSCAGVAWTLSGNNVFKNKSNVYIEDQFTFLSDSRNIIEDSRLISDGYIDLVGEVSVSTSTITSAEQIVTENANTVISSSVLHTKKLHIKCGQVNKNTILYAQNARLSGGLAISEVSLRADTVTIDTEKATIFALVATTKELDLRGSDKKRQVLFSQCTIQTDSLRQSKHVTFKSSSITAFNESARSHFVTGRLELDNTYLFCSNSLSDSMKGKLKMRNNSRLQSKELLISGKLKAANSTIAAASLLQKSSVVSTKNSQVYVSRHVAIGDDSKTTLKEKSTMIGEQVVHQGRLQLKKSGALLVKSKLITGKRALLRADDSALKINTLCTLGASELRQCTLSAEELGIYDQFSATKKSILVVRKETNIGKNASFNLQESALHTRQLDSFGHSMIDASNVSVQDSVNAWTNSTMELKGKSQASAGNISIFGTLHLRNQVVESKKAAQTEHSDKSEKKETPFIHARNELYFNDTAKIQGDTLRTEAKAFSNYSNDFHLQSVYATGEMCANHGLLRADDAIFLGFDHAVYNDNVISSKNVTIHSALFNILGSIFVEQRFSVSGLANMNLGLISANNYSSSTLLSMNFGLTVPNFCADSEYLFSRENLISFGKQLLLAGLPMQANMINLAFMAPGLMSTAKNLLHLYDVHNWKKLKSMRMHEIMPLVCQVKDACMFGYGAMTTATSALAEVPSLKKLVPVDSLWITTDDETSFWLTPENVKNYFLDINWMDKTKQRMDATTAYFSEVDWMGVTKKGIGLFGGSYTDNSLLHTNSGVNLSVNTSKNNLLHLSTGADLSLHSLSINSKLIYNSGISASPKSAFLGKHIANTGAIVGSDSLTIKADTLSNAKSGSVYGVGANVELDYLDQKGTLNLSKGKLTVTYDFDNSGETILKQMHVTGAALNHTGSLSAKQVKFGIDKFNLTESGKEYFEDVEVCARLFSDASQMTYNGSVIINTEQYLHTGHVAYQKPTATADVETDNTAEKASNFFYVKADEAKLEGSADIGNGRYDLANFADGVDFVTGKNGYDQYGFKGTLTFKFNDTFDLNTSIDRDCDITVSAASVTVRSDYDKKQALSFISTEGDINLLSDIKAESLYAKSAGNVYTNKTTDIDELFYVEAEGAYYNLGGAVNANVIAVTATSIQNITPSSELGKTQQSFVMGGTGILNGRSQVFLKATTGNIENHGGMIRAGHYAQLTAAGDVINLANTRTYSGTYDVEKQFIGGLISGGDGKDTDGLGLYVKADGQVLCDASDFVSTGDNYIEGVKGVRLSARSHTYISKDKYESKALGFSTKHVIETSTSIKGSQVHSANGRNMIYSGDGEVESVATAFTSPGGTDIFAKGDVKLYSLKTQDVRYESKTNWWGLSESKRKEVVQSATPTLFIDNGTTRIHSTEGNVDARGALFLGAGDLEIKAAKRIQFGVDILDHEITEKRRSIGFSAPGLGAWQAITNGDGLWAAASAEDATLAKLNSLYGSASTAEIAANAGNLGIDLFNTTNSAFRGIANSNITGEMLARYGLGDTDGFNPSVNISYTETKTNVKYQTLSSGGVNRGGNVILDAGEGVDLENGVQVHAGKNMEVNAPEVRAHAAQLNSSFSETSKGVNVGVTAKGQVTDVGASYSKTKEKSTQHVNASLSAGGHMHLHNNGEKMDLIELDGANIEANSISGGAKEARIIDKQDTSKVKTESYSASTSGQCSVYQGKGSEKITNQHSGIHVNSDLNSEENPFHINDVYMEGGAITSDGVNSFSADNVTAVSLKDEKKYSGIGGNFNVYDANRLLGNQSPENTAGENAIATATVSIDSVEYKATQTSVIRGNARTNLDIKTLNGALHTSSSDGREVHKDKEMHLAIDVPITNREYLAQAQQNIQVGIATLTNKSDQNQVDTPLDEAEDMLKEEEASEFEAEKELIEENKDPIIDQSQEANEEQSIAEEKSGQEYEMTQETIDNLLEQMKFSTPEKQRAFSDLIDTAITESEATGTVSLETENQLRTKMQDAFLQTIKAGSEARFGAIANALKDECLGVKLYVNGKNLLITFVFNLGLSHEQAPNEVVKAAVTNTAGSMLFNVALSKFIGGGSSPAGFVIVGLQIFDGVFYNQNVLDNIRSEAMMSMKNRMRKGFNYFEHIADTDRLEGVRQAEALHHILNVPSYIGSGFKWMWNNTVGTDNSSANHQSTTAAAQKDNAKKPQARPTDNHSDEPIAPKLQQFGIFFVPADLFDTPPCSVISNNTPKSAQ